MRLCLSVSAAGLLAIAPLAAQEPGPIQDNSFLIEEAYNQPSGVIQHIATFERASGGGAWALEFSEEQPLTGLTHQVGFTIPVEHPGDAAGTGLGDIWLNYRYQLVGTGETTVAFAPRLSVALPTGDADVGRGRGGFGAQVNLPLSVVLAPSLVAHINSGMTIFPSARGVGGVEATAVDAHAGVGLFWLVHPSFNIMFESLYLNEATVDGPGSTSRNDGFLLSPGVRGAFWVGGVQVVPGIGYPMGVGGLEGEDSLFLYLSLEH